MNKLNLFSLKQALVKLHKPIFTPQDIILLTNATPRATTGFLSYNLKKGKIARLKKGFYGFVDEPLNPYLVANQIYKPSYISFETALAYYQLIPETVYSIISATSKATRQFSVKGLSYIYHRLKKNAYTGFIPKIVEGERVLIALPEKALADQCYFIWQGKKSWNNRLQNGNLDFSKLKNYLQLFGQKNLMIFVKKYLPQL